MNSSIIGNMKYIDGHSDLGLRKIPVTLVAYPSNITVFHEEDNSPLFSIPWENIDNVWEGTIEKRGWDYTASYFTALIPFVDNTNLAERFFIGFWIKYWDEEIRRNQQVF